MSKRNPIRRGALGRGLAVSLAGARAGSVFALDGALRKLKGEGNDLRLQREAERFARSLGALKGSYVKIGQIFALLGEHFLPEPLTRALHSLESDTQPLDWGHMEEVFSQALGNKLTALQIEPQALAAASLAQVHRARIVSSNAEIVIKGQYPELIDLLDEDFDAVVRMLRLARWLPVSRDFDGWLSLMREQLKAEVDYPRERRMAERMATALNASHAKSAFPCEVYVPEYYPDFCSADVLAMEYIDGRRLSADLVAELSQETRNNLGKTMLRLFFVEVFDLGLMQSDPNFGNYLIDRDGRRLSLLDFGSVIELDATIQRALADTIISGHDEDDERLMDALIRLGCLREDSTDYARQTFQSFVRHLLEPLRHPERLPERYLNSDGQYAWATSDLMTRAGKKAAGSAATRHFSMPSAEFALIARKLTGVFTFIAVLEAEFNAWDVMESFIEKHRTTA